MMYLAIDEVGEGKAMFGIYTSNKRTLGYDLVPGKGATSAYKKIKSQPIFEKNAVIYEVKMTEKERTTPYNILLMWKKTFEEAFKKMGLKCDTYFKDYRERLMIKVYDINEEPIEIELGPVSLDVGTYDVEINISDPKQISLLKYNHFYQLEKEDMILKEWIPDEKYNFQLQRSRNLTYNYGRRSRPYSYFNTSIPE